MSTQKLTTITLFALVLSSQVLLAQSAANSQKSIDLAARVLAPLHLGPYAARPNSNGKTGPSAVAVGLAAAKTYKFASADYPGASISEVLDRNVGTILGITQFTNTSGFTLKGGNYQFLVLPGSQANLATGINTSGQIVGFYADSSANTHGFLLSGGVVTNIDNPSAVAGGTTPLDLNDSAEVVGQYTDSGGVLHGFSTPDGVSFTTIDFPGALSTAATGVNTAGDIVGQWEDASMNTHGFLLKGGLFTSLDFPLATSTTAFGVNDTDEIAGFFTDASTVIHGFIDSANSFSQVDVPGATTTQLTRIKNNGHITGVYVDQSDEEHGLTGH